MEQKSIIYPPGTALNSIIDGIIDETSAPIKDVTSELSSPKVNKAEFIKNGIDVSAKILVKTSLTKLTLIVNQLFIINNEGKNQLQFFIYCDVDQLILINQDLSLNPESLYNTFDVKFTTTNTEGFPKAPILTKEQEAFYTSGSIGMVDIEFIETFLWDIDPRTSRGTVTTVLHAGT
jgi:hypothetical protein